MKTTKQLLILAVLLVAAIAVSCGGNTKSQATANEDAVAADADAESLFRLGATGNEEVQFDEPYIHLASGDKWTFAHGEPEAGAEPMDVAAFRGNGMQGFQMYQLVSQGNSRYVLRDAEADEETDITISVYPGADSILVTRDGEGLVFKTAAATKERAVSGIDPDYTPERNSLPIGKGGCKWDYLQSGEIACVFPESGVYVRNTWVKDGDKLYYVDVSGCRMLNNWAYDGFYAGSDGSWDKSVPAIDRNVLPIDKAAYTDDSGKQWTFRIYTMDDGAIYGEAHLEYPKDLDFREDFNVHSFGNSAYWLAKRGDEFVTWHVVVLDEGRTIRVSGAGVTEVFRLND